MRIAVACTGLSVAPRYEKCESFMCYLIDHGIITGCQNVPNLSAAVTDTLDIIKALDVQVLLVNAISYDVAELFCNANIDLIAGVTGPAREAAEKYLSQTLLGTDSLCEDEAIDEEAVDDTDPFDFDDLESSLFADDGDDEDTV